MTPCLTAPLATKLSTELVDSAPLPAVAPAVRSLQLAVPLANGRLTASAPQWVSWLGAAGAVTSLPFGIVLGVGHLHLLACQQGVELAERSAEIPLSSCIVLVFPA